MSTAMAFRADGLCAQTDPDAFFPEKGGSSAAAKRVCAACPVTALCRTWAVAQSDIEGIWGGLSARQRRQLRTGSTATRGPAPIKHGTPGGYKAHRRRGEDACARCLNAERLRSNARAVAA